MKKLLKNTTKVEINQKLRPRTIVDSPLSQVSRFQEKLQVKNWLMKSMKNQLFRKSTAMLKLLWSQKMKMTMNSPSTLLTTKKTNRLKAMLPKRKAFLLWPIKGEMKRLIKDRL